MRYQALACDYDGTLAHRGMVDASTCAALERFVASGRSLILVTGRQMGDLESVFPRLDLFTRVVAENGALLVRPAAPAAHRVQKRLTEPPTRAFADALRARGAPVSVGDVIVATVEPHAEDARAIVRELGLPLHVILNKDAVMILPSGVDKRSGLEAALADLGLSLERTVSVGDAENDLPMLEACGLGVATANALDAVKARAGLVTRAPYGAGVAELIEHLLNENADPPRRP